MFFFTPLLNVSNYLAYKQFLWLPVQFQFNILPIYSPSTILALTQVLKHFMCAELWGQCCGTRWQGVLPDGQVLLDLGYEAHGGVGAGVHGGQDGDDHEEPGGGAGRIHPCDHAVLLTTEETAEVSSARSSEKLIYQSLNWKKNDQAATPSEQTLKFYTHTLEMSHFLQLCPSCCILPRFISRLFLSCFQRIGLKRCADWGCNLSIKHFIGYAWKTLLNHLFLFIMQ